MSRSLPATLQDYDNSCKSLPGNRRHQRAGPPGIGVDSLAIAVRNVDKRNKAFERVVTF
jgi:hypothetical protein